MLGQKSRGKVKYDGMAKWRRRWLYFNWEGIFIPRIDYFMMCILKIIIGIDNFISLLFPMLSLAAGGQNPEVLRYQQL